MCLSSILLARVDRIVYGALDLRLGAVKSWVRLADETHPFHSFQEVVGGVLEEECATLIREFFKSRRVESKSLGSPSV